jgi:hypothetical protein
VGFDAQHEKGRAKKMAENCVTSFANRIFGGSFAPAGSSFDIMPIRYRAAAP